MPDGLGARASAETVKAASPKSRPNLDFRCVYLTLLGGGCGQAGGKL